MLGLSFGNGITLVHFEQQTPRLFAANDHLNCRYIRSFFKRQGTTATQYIESNLPNIYDTAADVIALGNEFIAMHVTPASYRLCKRLTSILKEEDERNQVIWFGAVVKSFGEEVFQDTKVDGMVQWNPEKTIYMLVNTEVEDWPSIKGFIARTERNKSPEADETILFTKMEKEVAVCSSGLDELTGVWEDAAEGRQAVLLSVKCADPLGNTSDTMAGIRVHSPERLQRDLELAVRAARQTSPCFTVEGFDLILHEANREEILKVLEKVMDKASYQLAIRIDECNLSLLERLTQCGVKRIEIKVPMRITKEALPKAATLEYMKSQKQLDKSIVYSVTLVDDGIQEKDPVHTAELLGRWFTEGIIDTMAVRAEHSARNKAMLPVILPTAIADVMLQFLGTEPAPALLNGYLAYMTGYYPQQVMGIGVKHIGFTEDPGEEVYSNYLGEFTALNSALIYEYNQVCGEEINELIYYDADGLWKRTNQRFNYLSEAADREQYYLSNAHQVVQTNEHEFNLQLNDFLHMEPVLIHQMDYTKAADLGPDKKRIEFQFMNIASEEDLNAYLADVDHFSRTGTFQYGYEIQSYLVDSCRWSGAYSCGVKQLPRLFVDGEMAVSSCRGCSSIGSLEDSMDTLLMQTSVISDQEQLWRECGSCEIKDSCTKCSFLPSFINRQQYCDIRKKHKMMHLYMQTVQLLKGLNKYSQAFSGLSIANLRVSLPTCTHKYPYDHRGNGQSSVSETIFLFFIEDTPMVYNAGTQKILKLNELMALLLEGLIVGANAGEMKKVLMEHYQIEEGYASQIVSQAMDLFTQEGCLKRTSMVS
ncbi:MAG: hypothetical protein K6T94_16415 [Paenibacillus sp.]|nr:hypothetical protein [Paenibacillus sp.]